MQVSVNMVTNIYTIPLRVPSKILNSVSDYASLLSGGNSEGEFKLNPVLIYYSLNPRVLRGCSKLSLPVIWQANKMSWVMEALFEDWFKSCFSPAVKNYYKQNNVTFKALLVF